MNSKPFGRSACASALALALYSAFSPVPACAAATHMDAITLSYGSERSIADANGIEVGEPFEMDGTASSGTNAITSFSGNSSLNLTSEGVPGSTEETKDSGRIRLYGHHTAGDDFTGSAVFIWGSGVTAKLNANAGLLARSEFSTFVDYGYSSTIEVNAEGSGADEAVAVDNILQSQKSAGMRVRNGGKVVMTARDSNRIEGARQAVWADDSGTVSIKALRGSNILTVNADPANITAEDAALLLMNGASAEITAAGDNKITGVIKGINLGYNSGAASAEITSSGGSNIVSAVNSSGAEVLGGSSLVMTALRNNELYAGLISSEGYHAPGCTNDTSLVVSGRGSSASITAQEGSNLFVGAGENRDTSTNGLWTKNGGTATVSAPKGENIVSAVRVGVWAERNSKITMTGKSNTASSKINAVASVDGSEVEITAADGGMNTFFVREPFSEDNAVIASVAFDVMRPNEASYRPSKLTVNGPTTVYGNTYSLRANDKSELTLRYGEGSDVTGSADALNGGTLTIKPQAAGQKMTFRGSLYGRLGGTLEAQFTGQSTLTGNLVASEEGKASAELADSSAMTGSVLASGSGAASLSLSQSASLTGTSDTGLVSGRAQTGTVRIALSDSALWKMTGHSAATKVEGTGGTVDFQTPGTSLEAESLEGRHAFAMTLSMNGSGSDMLYIGQGTAEQQELRVKNLAALDGEMHAGDAVRFASVRSAGGGFTDGRTVGTLASGIYNSTFRVQYRSAESDALNTAAYNDAYNGDGSAKPSSADAEQLYGGSGASNIYLVKSQTVNEGAKTPARADTVVWRALTELDTYTKRRSQAHYSNPGDENGLWIRLGASSTGVSGVATIDGPSVEAGYKHWLENTEERKHSFGAAVSYLDSDGTWKGVHGTLDFSRAGIALYHTMEFFPKNETEAWLKDAPLYWDSWLKFGDSKTRYSVSDGATSVLYRGSHHQKWLTLSTEAGKKLPVTPSFYVVPQAQLSIGYLDDYSYRDSRGIAVRGDDSWSAIGRLGVDIVKTFGEGAGQTRVYGKASVLRQFGDGTDVTVSSHDRSTGTEASWTSYGDQGGTWGVVGGGASCLIDKGIYAFIDGEYVFGNGFTRTYVIRGSIRRTF